MNINGPDFIGIGAPKCATSWISDCLNEHPDIYVPPEKELLFFGPIHKFYLDKTHNDYPLGISWYLKHFEEASKLGKNIKGEFSTWYLFSDEIAENIHTHFPEAKIIIVLRNPVDRMYSFYMHLKAKYEIEPFECLIKAHPDFIAQGYYLSHINRYLRIFPQQQVKIILHDDIVSNPKLVIQELYDFLQVDQSFIPPSLQKQINATAPKINSFTSKNRTFINKMKKNPILAKILFMIKSKGLHRPILSLLNILTIKTKYQPISPKTKIELTVLYKKHNNKLASFLGRDLSHWNKLD